MKFKEIDRTASVAWSPAIVDNVYLAAGTAAQQLDSSFSTNAVLEIYQLNVSEPGLDVPVKATYTSENRFHKVVWGCHGSGGEKNEYPSGIIVGGCDGGVMQVFNANKLFQNEDPIILTKTKHTGPVRALDFNCFRSNLIASGATESEIFIWDLNNPKVPMSPGAKIQPSDDVTDLEWNKQVEHILATTFPARCVVWDLRKNEPVIKVSDSTSRIRYKCVRWHPEVATQMCLASEDDASPVIQLWDLRYATSPLKVIQGHQRGILGMSWCAQDPELLISCGKDSRILCWNPNYPHAGYEMVLDIPTASQWSFDVSFCPKNPIVLSSCTFDGRISIYGLCGGTQQPVISSKLADSFPGMDMSLSNAPVPAQPTVTQQLRDPPKWFKRPAGVSFAFGGRLVSFQNIKTPSTQPGVPDKISGTVNISQVVTLPSFIERSKKLEEALQTGSLEYFCAEKARVATDSKEAHIWEFLQASFSQNPRQAYVSLLGFNTPEMLNKLHEVVHTGNIDDLSNTFDALGKHTSKTDGEGDVGSFSGYQNGVNGLGSEISNLIPEFSVPTDESVDGRINQAILCGSIDVAVHLCLDNERWADAFLLASKGSPELMAQAQTKYFQKCQGASTNMIRAIVRNDLQYLVLNCKLDSWKQALATSLTYADSAEFQTIAETLGKRLLGSKNDNLTQGALLCFICSGSLNQLVDAWMGSSGVASSPDELQDLVEQVMILKKAAEMWGRDSGITGGSLAGKMVEYASILASQGCLETALNYLKDSNDPSINVLKERLQLSLGYTRPTRSQIAPRSRQTSESSGGRSMHKRPSHPAAPVKRNSEMFQPNDFSNLTGPVHPPTAPSFGSTNVMTTGYTAPSQYSPAPPPPQASGLGYGQQNAGSVGLPPKPPTASAMSAPPPALYNPADAAAEIISPASSSNLSIHNRPSHPAAPLKQSSDLYQPNDFSNLMGPAHPPSFGSNNAMTTGYTAPPQYNPAPPPHASGFGYGQQNVGAVGLPPKPPTASSMSAPPPALYNPTEATAEMIRNRPPHSTPSLKQNSELTYQPNDLSNLTGPVHSTPAPAYNSSAGYGAPSQYSPALPPQATGLLTYSQNNTGAIGMTPNHPPTAPPGSSPVLFNPAGVAAEMNSPNEHDSLQRKSSTGSLPRPPVSNVASGWNDPPPIMFSKRH